MRHDANGTTRWLIGPITPTNTLVEPEKGHFTTSYEVTPFGTQAVTQLEGGPTTQLELSVNKGPFAPVAIGFVDIGTPEKPLELSTK